MVSDDELEDDPDAYQCEACPVADALADLEADAENDRAWRMFQRVVSRFTVDTHIVSSVLTRMSGEFDDETFADLIERFAILYDAVCPPPERKDA